MGEEGEQFGRYRIVRRLGVGGTAEAFEAYRIEEACITPRVCLKRILPSFCGEPGFAARFEVEAQVAASLFHTNIIGVLDYGAVGDTPFMALELVHGTDLRALLRGSDGGRLDLDLATLIIGDVALALAHAHAPDARGRTVMHHDVSPSNVLITRAGDVKLTDFSIAKALRGDKDLLTAEVRGKVSYLAPEQLRADANDLRADLYALGIVYFELLTGRLPTQGPDEVATMTMVLAGERERLEALAPELPAEVIAIVDRLLAFDPAERFEDAGAVADALAQIPVDGDARRRLAAEVDALHGGIETRGHVIARQAIEAAQAARAAARRRAPRALPPPIPAAALRREPKDAAPPPRPRSRSRLRALGALTGLAAAAALGLWATASGTSTPADSAETLLAIVGGDTGVSRASAAATEAPPAVELDAGVPEPRAVRRIPSGVEGPLGRLRVSVVPWGNVWVDGQFVGRAPRTVSLAVGEHRVRVGDERPTRGRTVQVQAHETTYESFHLE